MVFPAFLLADNDSTARAKWFNFQAAYRLPLNKASVISSGHGLCFEAGFNFARFFSNKAVISLYGGWAWKDLLWNTSFNSDFARNYKSSLNSENFSGPLDSNIIQTSGRLISEKKDYSFTPPGCASSSFHNYSFYWGILFKIPCKLAPALKLYTGSVRSSFTGDAKELVTPNRDYNVFELRRRMFGTEVMFAERNSNKKFKTTLSAFFEYCNFKKAMLFFSDGETRRLIAISNYLPASFISKYSREFYFGIKLGVLFGG